MRSFLAVLVLSAVASSGLIVTATPAAGQFGAWSDGRVSNTARVWFEGGRDEFRSGDRVRLRFEAAEDAHVAVIHVDTEGRLEFLFPTTPWSDDFVRGGRTYGLPRGGPAASWALRDPPGIGYVYIIASPAPLDYSAFRHAAGRQWDWSYAGRRVRGDPFLALEQITRLLVPAGGRAPFATDYYTYYVGGRHRYPSYACSTEYGGSGWGWDSYSRVCDGMDVFLREHPDYFDTRRYRGSRVGLFGDARPVAPRDRLPARERVGRDTDGWEVLRPPRREPPRARPQPEAGRQRPEPRARPRKEPPPRQRPVLERRPRKRGGDPPRARPAPRPRDDLERDRRGATPRPRPVPPPTRSRPGG